MQNFKSIESLRAYMAWWVVASHALGLIGVYDTGVVLFNLPIKLISWASLPVNVFIMVSGFVITHLFLGKKENYSSYILRRLFRIFPIYLFCIFLAILLHGLRDIAFIDMSLISDKTTRIAIAHAEQENFWTHLILHFTMLHGLIPDSLLAYSSSAFLGPAWSLSLEWQFYLVAPIIIGLMARGWLTLIITFAGLYLAGLLAKSGALGHWNYPAFLLLSIQYFLIGIVSRFAMETFKHHARLWELPIIALLTFALANIIEAAIWISCITIALIESGRINRVPEFMRKLLHFFMLNQVITSLGRWSYSTYLIHIPLLTLVVGGFGYLYGTKDVSLQLLVSLVLACVPIIVLASWVLYSLVELPGIALGKRAINYAKRRNLVKEAALNAPV